jgi:isoleucyl-tRNA synthetase
MRCSATEQWFADVHKIIPQCTAEIASLLMVPESGRNRLQSTVASRSDWCISRQRSWGVPIPVVYDQETNEAVLTRESIEHILANVRKHGTDWWWTAPIDQLLCKSLANSGRSYRRGTDTVDVWFDSGSSWYSALQPRGIDTPVDLYLEGSDQHRGWFQSSLLTSGMACVH